MAPTPRLPVLYAPHRRLTLWGVDVDPAVLEQTVTALGELAPSLELVDPGWISIPTRGPARYFGGESEFTNRVTELVTALGFHGGLGIADGHFASAVAARRSAVSNGVVHPVVIEPGRSREFLESVPLPLLAMLVDVPEEFIDVMRRLGVSTCGDLVALPYRDVMARFGVIGARAHQLAAGRDDRPPQQHVPTGVSSVDHGFDSPVTVVEPVVFVAKRLADRLVDELTVRGQVCTTLVVTVETDHGERSQRRWYDARGMSSPAIVQRVRWQLDGWIAAGDAVTAGITFVHLAAEQVQPRSGEQLGLWGGRSQVDDDVARAIARLVGLAGEDIVRVPVWRGGRLLTERYRWDVAPQGDSGSDRAVSPARSVTDREWSGALPRPSPAVVCDPTVPIELLDASGRPLTVNGRGELSAPPADLMVDGRRRRVGQWAGPWPVDQRWWDPRRHRRLAHLQVVDEHWHAYVLVAEHRRWWLSAIYS